MAEKINWHKYATKLRHCHPMYSLLSPDFQSRSFPVASRGKSRGFQDPKSTNKNFVAWEHKAVGTWESHLRSGDSTPGRDVATDKAGGNHVFKVGGFQFLGLGYYFPSPERNLETYTQFGAVCYPQQIPSKKLRKKLGVRPNWGVRTPPPTFPVVAPMCESSNEAYNLQKKVTLKLGEHTSNRKFWL